MSERKKLFEAYIEDSKIKIDIVNTNEKGLPFLQYALKLLEIEITRRIIEQEYPESVIVSPSESDLILGRLKS